MTSQQIREKLVETLRLDLVGPDNRHAFAHELLPQSPRRWYLTGYLVPGRAPEEMRRNRDQEMETEEPTPGIGDDDNDNPEPQTQVSFAPSSAGLSVLAGPTVREITAVLRWGDYTGELEGKRGIEINEEAVDREYEEELTRTSGEKEADGAGKSFAPMDGKPSGEKPRKGFRREPREESVTIPLRGSEGSVELEAPNSRSVLIRAYWRTVPGLPGTGLPDGMKTVSVFVVNDRSESTGQWTFRSIIFQVELELRCESGFLGRPDLRGAAFPKEMEVDERIADLQYRDVLEYAVGHGLSAEAELDADGVCRRVRTQWIPKEEVPRVDHADSDTIGKVELTMERLGNLRDAAEAREALGMLPVSYRAWIDGQSGKLDPSSLGPARLETAIDLICAARVAADRIEEGVNLLSDPICLEAFRIANRAMARSARQRFAVQRGKRPEEVEAPQWRAFQLAFILMNLKGLFDPEDSGRRTVDLLFFPTGGGKTEAYLGLAAYTLVLRRLKNPGISSAGVSIIMRYTLRLLTLDQLGRGAALMCALELERAGNKALGDWPFEIGLWVGSAATPNRMGKRNDDSPGKDDTAFAKLQQFKKKPDKNPAPIPMEECPWCGTRFTPDSFDIEPPGAAEPKNLRVSCDNMDCEFSAANNDARLPVLGVDEPIYRRLPCFLIATVDKFASLPWTGQVGALFGKVDRYDGEGFYGPCDAGRGKALPGGSLPPPDLIIQDELHLISGPLGTVAGVYEIAIETLCRRRLPNGRETVPKIIASTATVRRAEQQIRALFGRQQTAVFPPPGPDRNDSFFSRTIPASPENPGRLYLGIAAQGRSMKVVLLRTTLALLSGAKRLYEEAGGEREDNPCDPYMTLLAYFNSLRELGGSRRIVEDEVFMQCQSRWKRQRLDPRGALYSNRHIKRDPVELTSRVSTGKVATARRQLASHFTQPDKVDVALATNMISVGLDIVRLGLMLVFGQPKTTSEYIQATSRVGRDKTRPGLIVTLLNAHKPRDRSHYERFGVFHRTFYRSVEAASVTPFSPKALDRALAGALVGLSRHLIAQMTLPSKAGSVQNHLPALQEAVRVFARRARIHDVDKATTSEGSELEHHVDALAQDLLAKWCKIAGMLQREGAGLRYQTYEGARDGGALIRDFTDPDLRSIPAEYSSFRVNRSMRDVEPSIDILVENSSMGTNA